MVSEGLEKGFVFQMSIKAQVCRDRVLFRTAY